MAFLHGKNSTTLLDKYDFSTYLNNVQVAANQDASESTTFQVPGGSRTYMPGLNTATVTLGGLFENTVTTGADALQSSYIGLATDVVWTHVPGIVAASSFGARCYLGQAISTQYQVTTPLADVVSTTMAMQCDAGALGGYVLQQASAVTASSSLGNPAGIDNLASSAFGGVANLHMITNTRDAGSILIKVQHSTDNSTYTDLISFSSINFATLSAQRGTVTGTVNRYVRAQFTVTAGTTGSYIFVVSFARRNG